MRGGTEEETESRRHHAPPTSPPPKKLKTFCPHTLCVSKEPLACSIARINYRRRRGVTYFAFFPPPCHAGVTESRRAIRSACTWRRRLCHRLFKPAIMTSHAVTVPGLVAQGAITPTHHWDTYDNNTCLSPVSELLSNQMKKADFGTCFLCSTRSASENSLLLKKQTFVMSQRAQESLPSVVATPPDWLTCSQLVPVVWKVQQRIGFKRR